jgi:hypothetical protein
MEALSCSDPAHALKIAGLTLLMIVATTRATDPVDQLRTGDALPPLEVPMIGGMARMGRWFIDRGMRKGTPATLHENVITVYTKTGEWKRRLAVSSANDTHALAIVLDRDGIVRWLYDGPFDRVRAQELRTLWADFHR